ncbi:MAG: MerR family transcriptional regulator [Pseudomonas sp.]
MTEPTTTSSAPVAIDELLPIRDVVRLTGVNPVTLRAWERRYGLIEPLRTEGGHRLYSQQDVDTIRNIMSWTERGIAVSKVGELLERSKLLSAGAEEGASTGQSGTDLAAGGATLLHGKNDLLQAVANFDEPRLEQLYGQLFATCKTSLLFEELLLPVWHELLHQSGFGQRSQWLFYDAFLRARVLQRLHLARRPTEPVILLAALPEQCRELELLVTGLLLDDDTLGVHVLALGQPLDELPLLCQAIQPSALVLYAPAPLAENHRRQLARLVLAIDCPLALAGIGAELDAEALRGTPIASLGGQPTLIRQRLRRFIDGNLDT